MRKLKLSAIENDKPVKVTHELPPTIHRDLVTYVDILARESGHRSAIPSDSSRRCWRGS